MNVIAFDCFGTVFDLSSVPREEIRDYAEQVHRDYWSPLVLPESWKQLPAHADSAEGIKRLRDRFVVVTCSNAPLGLMVELSKHNGINWDAIIPLELRRVYKPDPRAYLTVCEALGVEPSDVLLVTANKDFGDLEGSAAVGMKSMLIRHPGCPQTIIELAADLAK